MTQYSVDIQQHFEDAMMNYLQYLRPSNNVTAFTMICLLICLVGTIVAVLLTQNKKQNNEKAASDKIDTGRPGIQQNGQIISQIPDDNDCKKKADTYNMSCFFLGLVSLFINPMYLFSILSLAFSNFATKRHDSARKDEMRKIGVVLAIIGLIKAIIVSIIVILYLSVMGHIIKDELNLYTSQSESYNSQSIEVQTIDADDQNVGMFFDIDECAYIYETNSINEEEKYNELVESNRSSYIQYYIPAGNSNIDFKNSLDNAVLDGYEIIIVPDNKYDLACNHGEQYRDVTILKIDDILSAK